MSFVHTLHFVEKKHEEGDVYTFFFSSKQKLHHKAGQHGIFVLPGLRRPHPFSLSSAPDEEHVSFTTHTETGSPFKKKLMAMKPGDIILFFGPVMNFTFAENESKHVLLAQGIGITPFRSMLVHAHTNNLPLTTTLIHVDSAPHAFRGITESSATHAFYPQSAEEFRKLVGEQAADQIFYLSGSPRFISSTKKLLRTMGAASSGIKTDSFLGY